MRKLSVNLKQLIPMMILSLIWLILSILSAFWINPLALRILSFLTFAQGGMYGGILGAVGGIIGKGFFAYIVTILILPLFSGKNPFIGMNKGFKSFIKGFAVKNFNDVGYLIVGAGIGLIVFNFLTGNSSPINSMAGLLGLVLVIKILWKKTGFVWTTLLSATNKISKGKIKELTSVQHILSGYGAGSALGILISIIRISYLPYLLGAFFTIVGIVLCFFVKAKGEVTT